MVVKMTDSAADAEQNALSGASRRPPNAQACPAWRRKRAKPPSPCPQTVGRSPPSVLRAQKATDGKRKGKWQQASCTSLPTTTSTRTWLAVGTTKDRGQRGGGNLRQYGQGGYIHRLRQPKATHAKNKTTHGTRVQNEPTISIARPHASVTSFPGMRRDFAPHILSGFSVVSLVSRRHSGSNKRTEPNHKFLTHPPIEFIGLKFPRIISLVSKKLHRLSFHTVLQRKS